jgi:hypothetical protein
VPAQIKVQASGGPPRLSRVKRSGARSSVIRSSGAGCSRRRTLCWLSPSIPSTALIGIYDETMLRCIRLTSRSWSSGPMSKSTVESRTRPPCSTVPSKKLCRLPGKFSEVDRSKYKCWKGSLAYNHCLIRKLLLGLAGGVGWRIGDCLVVIRS